MKKILLACSSGMSTSLLVTKMQDYAKSIGDEAEIWAVGQDQAAEDMAKADAVLIGPQMSFLKGQLEKEAAQYGIYVEVIDMMAYGMVDGKKAYEQAVKLVERKNG
ncbi:PTS sugar transporter subunit IIB [Paenibacillus polymyxa]|uniref:PTS sugar transporter subunit IIB n=1 Tax=Paenibacillus TaxID=44249 RepID=UPI0004D53BDD|nr:PTS sugar transporter subunit IIB [Paenibacillus polymyxa]AOK90448.1 PTS sugar transporter subunit IIB [Paenibacillus polymyxa]KEO78917.1 PTS mannose transporter subunit IIB [Paenibacillus polymyxa]KYG95488.1 PTS sugar transporter subunit IIB [Paenibacillus polymyxa]MCH6187796.1 PTS sugar transporter subunit IIB [Paenibacillus polymyxa]WRL57274.1 PTS sugar transporter subunit IIB [Paenibacillus polymyxa]